MDRERGRVGDGRAENGLAGGQPRAARGCDAAYLRGVRTTCPAQITHV